MKTLLVFFSGWLLLAYTSQAQIDTMFVPYVYCELVEQVTWARKINVTVDFGHEFNPHIKNKTTLKDEQGETIQFNSIVDAMNYMSRQGWDFVQTYSDADKRTHWLLRRRGEK